MRETVPKGDDVDPQGGEGGPAAPPGRHVGKIERSVIVEPVAAQLEGHVQKVEGSEAVGLVAQSGGHVGHIESSVVDHVEGSWGMDSYVGEGVQSSNCKYVNCKSKRCLGKLVTRDPGEETFSLWTSLSCWFLPLHSQPSTHILPHISCY